MNAAQSSAAHRVIMEILPLREQRWIDVNKIVELPERLAIHDVEAKIYFLRELTNMVRKLSMKIYQDPEDRLRLIDALQQAPERSAG